MCASRSKARVMKWNSTTGAMFVVCLFGMLGPVSILSAESPETPDAVEGSSPAPVEYTIVLLQGMGRGRASLWMLDTRLQHAGYQTLNFPYSAGRDSIDGLGEQLVSFIRENVKTEGYHLIAHSLGNVILRAAFRFGYPPGLGCIVMLAPPNEPADLARALRDNQIHQWFMGPSGQQLASDTFYAQLPVPDVKFGIIAGDRGQSFILKQPNDGVITVENTKLAGMSDWIVVHQSHNFIMNSRIVAEFCISFIEDGVFNRQLPVDAQREQAPEGEPEGGTEGEGGG